MNRQNLLFLANYNVWATQRLAKHLNQLTDEALLQDVGLHFKSIHGTLNHLLLGEHYLWYPRFKDGVSNRYALDSLIEPDPRKCIQALLDRAPLWIDFIQNLNAERLHELLHYRRGNGEALTLAFTPTLMHVFNHGTHHRGQITAAMTYLGHECPELGMVYMLAEQHRHQ